MEQSLGALYLQPELVQILLALLAIFGGKMSLYILRNLQEEIALIGVHPSSYPRHNAILVGYLIELSPLPCGHGLYAFSVAIGTAGYEPFHVSIYHIHNLSLFTIHYSLAKRYEYRLGYLKMMDNNAVRPMTSG